MIYNTELDKQKALTRFFYLIEKGKTFELTEKKPIRSISQNNYLHLILSMFALEYGETLEYVKLEFFKKIVNKHIFEFEFINRKTGEVRTEYKSTSILTTEELTTAIDRFRDYSAKEVGLYLPEPRDLACLTENEQVEIEELKNEVQNNQHLI